jgi:hypothetical protein
MTRAIVAGEPAAERLTKYIAIQKGYNRVEGVDLPTDNQVALVLHALADHTAIMEMLKHRPDPSSPWQEATSVGRWFHDVADELEAKN